MRLRLRTSSIFQLIAKGSATAGPNRSASADGAPGGTTNCIRRKNVPPVGSEEYWCELSMFAPASARKRATAATIPTRSGQVTTSRIVTACSRAASLVCVSLTKAGVGVCLESGGGVEGLGFVGLFPGEVGVFAAEVAVGGGLLVDRAVELEFFAE